MLQPFCTHSLNHQQVKQKWGFSLDANFRATSNARNEAMFREASTFAGHLRQVDKDLTAWARDIECEPFCVVF